MDKGCLLKSVAFRLMLLIILASAFSASARIFSRRTAGDDISALLQEIGGRCAYRAPVRINGSPSLLAVIGFDDPHNLRMAEIRAALQLDATATGIDTLHIIEHAGKVTRLLLLRPAGGDQTLAVTIEQTVAAFRQSRADVPRGMCPLPVYPGATPGLQAENEETGLFFTSMTSVADPLRIAAFYQASLAAAGWVPAFPESGPHSGLLFLKKNALCMVLIIPEGESTARITLLHKPFKDLQP